MTDSERNTRTAPSGWWIVPAAIVGPVAWYLVFKLVIALYQAFMAFLAAI